MVKEIPVNHKNINNENIDSSTNKIRLTITISRCVATIPGQASCPPSVKNATDRDGHAHEVFFAHAAASRTHK
jgi:hypothetical protein